MLQQSWAGRSGCCCTGSSLMPSGAKVNVVIPHTRSWLALLAELCDAARDLGCECSAVYIARRPLQQRWPLCSGLAPSDAKGVMNHILWGRLCTAQFSVYSFQQFETVAGLPQSIRHRDMCSKEKKTSGPKFIIPTAQTYRPSPMSSSWLG